MLVCLSCIFELCCVTHCKHYCLSSLSAARPVARPRDVQLLQPNSGGSISDKNALLAGAGVQIVGQTKRSPYLTTS